MFAPDADVKVAWRAHSTLHPDALATIDYTDDPGYPACAVMSLGMGKVAGLSTRPAFGAGPRNAIWDGWGQYHRACFAGLMGWLSSAWKEMD